MRLPFSMPLRRRICAAAICHLPLPRRSLLSDRPVGDSGRRGGSLRLDRRRGAARLHRLPPRLPRLCRGCCLLCSRVHRRRASCRGSCCGRGRRSRSLCRDCCGSLRLGGGICGARAVRARLTAPALALIVVDDAQETHGRVDPVLVHLERLVQIRKLHRLALPSQSVGSQGERRGGHEPRRVLQACGGAVRVVDEVPRNLRQVARPRDRLDVGEQRPVRVLNGEIKPDGLQQNPLGDEHFLLELVHLARLGLGDAVVLDVLVPVLERLHNHVLELARRLLHL
mmetsp:Transcript_30493/g.97543  ORF Transcript_30493/g.97543 Transcript_30493/m.97543 type:complete len:283 (-) Transcript_30493:398-1246(-)